MLLGQELGLAVIIYEPTLLTALGLGVTLGLVEAKLRLVATGMIGCSSCCIYVQPFFFILIFVLRILLVVVIVFEVDRLAVVNVVIALVFVVVVVSYVLAVEQVVVLDYSYLHVYH